RSTLKRLSGVRNVGWAMAKTVIRTTRKMSGAKRARKPIRSNLAGAGASVRAASVIRFSSRRPPAQCHHRHQRLLGRLIAHRLAGDAALTHGDDPVADREHLR